MLRVLAVIIFSVATGALMLLTGAGCGRPQPDWTFRSSGDGTVQCSCAPTTPPPGTPSPLAAHGEGKARSYGDPPGRPVEPIWGPCDREEESTGAPDSGPEMNTTSVQGSE